jgi:hypothetical protein
LRNILVIILLNLFAGTYLHAQSADRFLKQLPQENAILFFLVPQKWKSKTFKGKLEADFTYYLGKRDSTTVSMGISLEQKGESSPTVDKLEVKWMNESLQIDEGKLTQLFLDRKGKKWLARYSSTLSEEQFWALLNESEDLQLVLYQGGEKYSFYPHKKWEKMKGVVVPILEFERKKRGQ